MPQTEETEPALKATEVMTFDAGFIELVGP